MNVKQLIEKYKKLEGVWDAEGAEIARRIFLQDLEQLDEPETGHADEAPRYVKNILARLRELPVHDREVWLKAIISWVNLNRTLVMQNGVKATSKVNLREHGLVIN